MKKAFIGLMLLSSTTYTAAANKALDQTGWIVGGGLGVTTLTLRPRNQPLLEPMKKDATLYTAFGGFNFTDWFGIEFDLSKSDDVTDVNTGLDAYIVGTSFTPKFTYRFNKNLDAYVKAGLQYIAYKQTIASYYDDDITWNGIDPFFGIGMQYSFPVGVRARLDYKYATITLDRSESSSFGYFYYDEEIDLTFSAITMSLNYQF